VVEPGKSQQVMRERKRLEGILATDEDLARRSEDVKAYFELGREGEDVTADLRREIDSLRQFVERVETSTLLSGENDARNAIVTIHPALAERNHKTGPRCFCACICGGPSGKASVRRSTIISRGKKQALSPLPSPLPATTPMAC